jgi:hypothetical protein
MTSRGRGNGRLSAIAVAVLACGGGLGAASCKDKAPSDAAAASASAVASAAASATASAAAAPERGGNDDVGPVYPIDNQPPLPLAQRYCEVVQENPNKRREACCPSMPGFVPVAECVRTLSSALRSGAVTIDAAALDACAAAVAKETAGCDWVTSVGAPTIPACLGIIKGTIKEGARCRSNLECDEGMRCRSLGATHPGKCMPPLPERRMCNISTDSLAAFTGQDDFERRHPECAGYCLRKQCVEAIAVGGSCTASVQCGPKGRCVAGKCSDGAPPGPGQGCTDVCAAGARCSSGKCVATKGDGESCENDAECRAQCERADGAKTGKCARQCPSLAKPAATPPPKGH